MSDRAEHDEAQRIADAFVAARREARPLLDYPGALPRSLDEAYRVQDRALALERMVDLAIGLADSRAPGGQSQLDARLGLK